MNEQNNNKTKWLPLHPSVEEFGKIQKNFSKTTCLKISEYARKMLLNKPITAPTETSPSMTLWQR